MSPARWTRDTSRSCSCSNGSGPTSRASARSYLGPKGFTAVQISPPNEHAWVTSGDGAPYPWWMRYQPVSYRLDRSRSGTRAQFIDMVNRCNAVGVGDLRRRGDQPHDPGRGDHVERRQQPVGRQELPERAVRYRRLPRHVLDHQLQRCGPGPELRALRAPRSQHRLGLRARQDRRLPGRSLQPSGSGGSGSTRPSTSARPIWAPSSSAVEARVATPPFWFFEVIGAAGEAVQPNQYFALGTNQVDVTEFGYGRELFGKFIGGGKLADLRTFGETWNLMPSDHAVAFTDNHDKQRGHGGGGNYLTYHNGTTYDLGQRLHAGVAVRLPGPDVELRVLDGEQLRHQLRAAARSGHRGHARPVGRRRHRPGVLRPEPRRLGLRASLPPDRQHGRVPQRDDEPDVSSPTGGTTAATRSRSAAATPASWSSTRSPARCPAASRPASPPGRTATSSRATSRRPRPAAPAPAPW